MDADQLADVSTDMLIAFLAGARPRLHTMIQELLAGPRGDSLGVALTFAACVAEDMELPPGADFHRLTVSIQAADGTVREGSADELPGHLRVFSQMVVAVANGDKDTATALFIGYVGDDAHRALHVVTIGLGVAARHLTSATCLCPPGTHQ